MSLIIGAITAIAAAATTVVKALTVVGSVLTALKAIGNVLVNLGKALGLIKPEMKIEDLGDKAIQSGYNPEDYDSYSDYVKAVEDYDDLDPEKSKVIKEEEKIKKGMELAAGATIEKFQGFPIEDFCTAIGQNFEFFTEAKINEIAKLMQADGQQIPSILNYINGTEKDPMKIQSAVDTLVNIEKSANSEISDKEAFKNVMRLRE